MSNKIMLLAALAVAGCNVSARDPLPYSPNYHYLDTAPSEVIRKGYETQTPLVPDACTTPDVAADPLYLPRGCANAVNLQQMVANPSDLMRGRTPGPAMAAPAARAARRVIDGTQPPPPVSENETMSTTRILY